MARDQIPREWSIIGIIRNALSPPDVPGSILMAGQGLGPGV